MEIPKIKIFITDENDNLIYRLWVHAPYEMPRERLIEGTLEALNDRYETENAPSANVMQ